MRVWMLFILAALIGPAVYTARAWDHSDRGQRHRKDDDDDDRDRHQRYGETCFRGEHIRILYEYYHPRDLPPGLRKKLYRTGHLPPGWEKKVRPFPIVIEQRLPPVCGGCARGYLDGYAIVYYPRTRLIIDVHAIIP